MKCRKFLLRLCVLAGALASLPSERARAASILIDDFATGDNTIDATAAAPGGDADTDGDATSSWGGQRDYVVGTIGGSGTVTTGWDGTYGFFQSTTGTTNYTQNIWWGAAGPDANNDFTTLGVNVEFELSIFDFTGAASSIDLFLTLTDFDGTLETVTTTISNADSYPRTVSWFSSEFTVALDFSDITDINLGSSGNAGGDSFAVQFSNFQAQDVPLPNALIMGIAGLIGLFMRRRYRPQPVVA